MFYNVGILGRMLDIIHATINISEAECYKLLRSPFVLPLAPIRPLLPLYIRE